MFRYYKYDSKKLITIVVVAQVSEVANEPLLLNTIGLKAEDRLDEKYCTLILS